MLEKLEYNKYKELRDNYEKKVSRIANIRMIMFIIMIISFILKYYYYPLIFNMFFLVSFVVFFIMVIVHNKYFKIYDYYDKYLSILDKYLSRSNGKWKEFKDTGLDLMDETNYYLSDLDIFGDCSLFQYLSICTTLGGREKLANKISNLKMNKEELILNQKLIEELTNDIDFNIKFQVMMKKYEDKNIHLTKDLDMFNCDNDSRLKDFFIGLIASIICIILFLLGFFNILSYTYFYVMFIFNLGISFLYFYLFREDFINLEKLIKNYSSLVSVFKFIADYKGKSSKLKNISKNMSNGIEDILKLKRLDSINSLRNNIISNFLLNGFCCLNIIVIYKYFIFLKKHFSNLKSSILDIEEMEAMISLATIGIVREDKCIPSLNNKISLDFNELKHPLIDSDKCISNDFNNKANVNIITGSNMGGKTTFLRTIGINLILMQSGTYVCAKEFSASYFKIFTSMRVMDNINKGISTFYGELLRIKDMVSYNGEDNMLVLIDEIFKGTNYNDRMYGAKEVVNKLNNKNNIVFITTHDFELCESKNVKNYHVKEDYEGDKIIFDYKIREGKCSSTNAKYLMKKLGIID